MVEKELKATLVKRTSKKGTDYECVMVQLTPTYEKPVFLEAAELELLKATIDDSSTKNKSKIDDIFK